MDDHNFSFEDLNAYKAARMLVKEIYLCQQKFPKSELYALGDQVRRAAVSITANLAEGSGRNSVKEKIHFIEISYGSLMEVYCELQTAQDLGYLTDSDMNSLKPMFVELAKMLSGLKSYFESKVEK